ncbi:hypothetical protein A2692_05630 [Candidatus Woesebacteria bacterium RIFCSPHIGHO2_01_FULL_39_95]|nr:MAG: hypothetical protein A2692_05630 [Candidatus Woesebacteria bacterium RIFCSPHIGHO2_01_FULL_39_95]
MLVMFLDESGDHNLKIIDKSYPVFCLAGCIFDFDYYIKNVEDKIEKLKIKHFNSREVILRSYYIRKQKGQFNSLVDSQKRELFYNDLSKLISSLDFKIIAAVILKEKLKNNYSTPSDPYDLCFQFILERLCMFIGRKNEVAIMRMESRETHNDKILAEDYEHFRSNGNNIIKAEEVRMKLADLSFNQKSQNVAGHQIADLIAYPVGSKILNPTKQNKTFEVIKDKFHTKPGTKSFLNYGLKIFP